MNAPSEYIQLTEQEQLQLYSVAREAGIQLSDSAFSQVSKSAQDHKREHGDLNDWIYRGQSIGAELARIDRAAAAERKAVLKAAGIKPRYVTKAEMRYVMRTAHDACVLDEGRPSASEMLRDAGVPAETASKLASRGSIHTKEVWQEYENHPARVAMRKYGVLSKRKERAATSASIAGTFSALFGFADHAKDLGRLAVAEERLTTVEDELAALKARVAALEARQDITEAGEHWHAIALRMKADGATIAAIATATGQKPDTVKKYLQRNR